MIRLLPGEQWKDVVFDDSISKKEKFKISNYGRIMNCKNYMGKDDFITRGGNVNGYSMIQIRKENGRKTGRYIHKIVAEHFLEKPSDLHKYVIHLDYSKENNQVTNLKWATKKEKEVHQFSNPEFKNIVRKNTKDRYKLNESKVKLIKRKINDPNRKTRLKMIAKQFGISEMQLHRIKTGENWGEVEAY